VKARGDHLHFARRNLRIRFLPAYHAALDRDDKLRPQFLGLCMRLGMLLLVEDNLGDSRAVAQVDEDQLAQVAPFVDPAHQDHVLICVPRAQFSAILSPFQIPQSIKQVCLPSSG
jgi:hypothetical protein